MIRWRPILAGLAVLVTVAVASGVLLPASPHRSDHLTWASMPPLPPSIEDLAATPPDTPPVEQVENQAEQRPWNETELTAALQRYDDGKNVDLSVMVVDRNTGRTFGYNTQRRFEAASIVKVDILAALLLQAERSGRPLTASEKNLATVMIENSDNAAATALWNRIGGIARSADVFGLAATAPGPDGRWGNATTTAEDQARLINALAGPNSPIKSSAYVFGLMRNVADSQAWGISAAAEPSETVALKNGWMLSSASRGRWAVNSMGRITDSHTDVTIVVLSRGHANFKAGVSMVEEVAKLARKHLGW